MQEQERQHPERRRATTAGGEGDDGLAAAAAQGNTMLQAGQDAINKALTANATAFLRATKQHGGQ